MQTRTSSKRGFTLVEIVIVVILLAAIVVFVVPAFHARFGGRGPHPPKNSCIANLKQIDGAKEQWAVEQKQLRSAVPAYSDIFGADLYIRALPLCPISGTYTLNAVSIKPTCSLSAAPDFHTL